MSSLNPALKAIIQDCLDSITSCYRCAVCGSDAIKLEITYLTSENEIMRQINLGDVIEAHWDKTEGVYKPSDIIRPYCHPCSLKRRAELNKTVHLFIGDEDLTI